MVYRVIHKHFLIQRRDLHHMKTPVRVNSMTKKQLRQFECNNEKCWLHVGLTTITLMTGFTLSMINASAQSASADTVPAAQTATANTASDLVNDTSKQDGAQPTSNDTDTEKTEAVTASKPSTEPAVTASSAGAQKSAENQQSSLKETKATASVADTSNSSAVSAASKMTFKAASKSISNDATDEAATAKGAVSNLTDKDSQVVQTVTSIDDDTFLKSLGIDVDGFKCE